MRFVGLERHEPVPDAKTIWLYREQLKRAGAGGVGVGASDIKSSGWCGSTAVPDAVRRGYGGDWRTAGST
jgi:hypothetical protein